MGCWYVVMDRFVRIRVAPEVSGELDFDPESGRRGYRTAVVRACVEGYACAGHTDPAGIGCTACRTRRAS